MRSERVDEVDLIVIGSGQGGVPLATTLASEGKQVVLFERGALGGSCINYGCTPSKALLASAHNAGRARAAGPLGVHADVRVDAPAALSRARRIRSEFSAGVGKRLADAGVEVVCAQAAFVGERTVRGADRTVSAPIVAIDTGTAAAVPAVPGLSGSPYMTNETFFDQPDLPRHLIVLGAGYIGLELGQAARRLGSEVTVVHKRDRVLDREEDDAGRLVREALEEDGVRFAFDASVASVAFAERRFTLTLDDGRTVEGDALLVATGRVPNTAALDLDASQVARTKAGFVQVDDYLRATCPGVYAIGDVAGQPAFTHVSWEDHRRILSTLRGTPRRRDDRVLSYTTYTEPQLARTGSTEAEARALGIDARAVMLPLSSVARAIEWNLERGFFRLVVERATGRIIGATFVGYEAGELIHVIVAHIEAGSTWHVLERSMHIHPTLAEGLPSLARLLA